MWVPSGSTKHQGNFPPRQAPGRSTCIYLKSYAEAPAITSCSKNWTGEKKLTSTEQSYLTNTKVILQKGTLLVQISLIVVELSQSPSEVTALRSRSLIRHPFEVSVPVFLEEPRGLVVCPWKPNRGGHNRRTGHEHPLHRDDGHMKLVQLSGLEADDYRLGRGRRRLAVSDLLPATPRVARAVHTLVEVHVAWSGEREKGWL